MEKLNQNLVKSVLEQVCSFVKIGICLCKDDGSILFMNKKAVELLTDNKGMSCDTVNGMNMSDINSLCVPILEQVLKEKEANDVEVQITERNLWLLFNGCLVECSDENETYLLTTIVEISQFKNIECKLQKSETKLNSIINTIPDIVYRLNSDGVITFISDEIVNYGYTEDELIGKNMFDLVHQEDKDNSSFRLNERRTGERRTRSFELRLKVRNRYYKNLPVPKSDEIYENFHISSEGLYAINESEEKVFIGTQGIARDIGVWRNIEYELRTSEERTKAIVNTLEDGYYEANLKGSFTFVNSAFCNISGYPSQEIIGEDFKKIFEPKVAEEIREIFTAAFNTGKPEMLSDWELKRKDGMKRFIDGSISLIKDNSNDIIGFRGIVRDITKKKNIEEELLQARKIEAVGILAGGIAHDYNNALTAILGNLSLAKMEIKEDDKDLLEILNDAEKASMKVLDLTKRLSTFAKGGKPTLRPTPPDLLKQLFEDKIGALLFDYDVEYELNFADNIPEVEMDIIQMGHVIEHIVTNAREAMPEKGKVTITVQNILIDEVRTSNDLSLQPDRYLKISFHDEGEGISEDILGNIFDPYFTTKKVSSGMGLAISYAIIKRHHGYIDVDSKAGEGATFDVYLPIHSI